MPSRNRAAIRLHQCRYWTGFAGPVRCCNSIKESSSTTHVSCDRTAFFYIFRAGNASCLLQFVYAPAREMRDCNGSIPVGTRFCSAKSNVLYLCFRLTLFCVMQSPRFTASKPLKFAFTSDEKSIRQPTTSFVRCYLKSAAAQKSAHRISKVDSVC